MKTIEAPWLKHGRVLLCLWLLACVAVCLLRTMHWPLVNDGALQHYISFLMDQGMTPYRQLLDMNLPGSLMIDWAVVHTLGYGPFAWRLFDALLMFTAGAAMLAIAQPSDWFAGVFAGALFWLLHARDGMGQTGQRDMMEAVLLLAMYAFAFHSVRSHRRSSMVASGLCASIAVTIKPDSLLLAVILLALALLQLRVQGRRSSAYLAAAVAAFLIPISAAAAFLLREHAFGAFWFSVTEVTPFYASLGRQALPELLRDCLSPPMRLLAAVALLIALARRQGNAWERRALLLAVGWGLASFFLQGKGYLYHRYPTLGFLLLWSAIECSGAVRRGGWLRFVGGAGLLYGALVIAPLSLARASRATWNMSLVNALQADLQALGGRALAGKIQCIDSISGCNTTLLRMRLPEETGMLSDFLIFGSEQRPVVRETRAIFWSEITAQPPTVIVVTGWLHPIGVDNYAKLALWPQFADFLAERYILAQQRSFSPGMNGPLGYRIYTLRSTPPSLP